MQRIPASAWDLLGPPHHAVIASIMPDGSPQLSPVWIMHEEGVASFNTAAGRVKVRNFERDPRCAFVVFDRSNPERYLHVRGRVGMEADEDLIHCDTLARLYTGERFRELLPGEARLKVQISPEHVSCQEGE